MHANDGGLLAMAVNDTIKQSNTDGTIKQTLDRANNLASCDAAIIPVQLLHRCLQQTINDNIPVTDEASAMEYCGFHPLIVPCDPNNIKITTPSDLNYAQWVLENRRSI